MGKRKASITQDGQPAEPMREWPPKDRNIEPKYILVYVAKEPTSVFRIARTHARSFETVDELLTFAHNNEIAASDLIGAWNLGEPLNLQQATVEVPEVKLVQTWTAEGAR